ncbi:MAG: type VI secretion system protein TssA [Gammaproteobacteria bacterium]
MSTLDLDRFLVALSDEGPCGDDLEYDPEFTALETAALGKPEQQMGETIKEAEPPNWSAVRKDAIKLLERTRDLRILSILTEASLHLEGLPAVYDCLHLLSGLVEEFWDNVHPRLDPDDDYDPTLRINILNGLCDFERIIRPLSRIPIVGSKGLGAFGLRDIQIASGKIPAPENGNAASANEIEAAFRDSDPEALQATLAATGGCIQELENIERAFTSRLGAQDSPDFSALLSVLKEIRQVIGSYTDAPGEDNEGLGDEGSESGGGPTASSAASPRSGGIQGPQDVVRSLDLICDYYRKHEPSSPIPILLTRAKNLVSKDFMEIMKDLAPDGLAQVEVFRGRDGEEEGY